MPPGRAGGGPEAAAGFRGGGPDSAASSCPALPGGCGAGRTAPVRRRGPDTRLLRLLLLAARSERDRRFLPVSRCGGDRSALKGKRR